MLDCITNSKIHVKPSLSMVFEPAVWNSEDLLGRTNCFAYALNAPKAGYPFAFHLRRESHDDHDRLTSHQKMMYNFRAVATESQFVGLSLEFLGLERIREHQYDPRKRHVIALTPDACHFLRLDGDGTWSHKNGATFATRFDDNGSVIDNLERAFFKSSSSQSPKMQDYELRLACKVKQKLAQECVVGSADEEEKLDHISRARIWKNVSNALLSNRSKVGDYAYFAVPTSGVFIQPK